MSVERVSGCWWAECPDGVESAENWFVVEKGKAIWWVYSDSSDGGSWSSEGIKITGFRIDFDEPIAQNIYELVYQTMTAETRKPKK